ncbi:MAG: hypothetical protein ABI597_11550 [Gammaproteobacteria bacterium]
MQSSKKIINIDNPGKGNCGFYAFANGLIPILQREIILGEKPRINKIVKFIAENNFDWPTFEMDIAAIKDFKGAIHKIALEKFNHLLRMILVSSQRKCILDGLQKDVGLEKENKDKIDKTRIEQHDAIEKAKDLLASAKQKLIATKESLRVLEEPDQENTVRDDLEGQVKIDQLAVDDAYRNYFKVMSLIPSRELSFRGVSADSLMADAFGVFEYYLVGTGKHILNTDVARNKDLTSVIKATVEEVKLLSKGNNSQKPIRQLPKQKNSPTFTIEQMYNHLKIRLLYDDAAPKIKDELDNESAEIKVDDSPDQVEKTKANEVIANDPPIEEKIVDVVKSTALEFNPASPIGRFILDKLEDGKLATQQDLSYLAVFFDIRLDVFFTRLILKQPDPSKDGLPVVNAKKVYVLFDGAAQEKPSYSLDDCPVINIRNIGNRHWVTCFLSHDPNWVTLLLLQQDMVNKKLIAALSVDTIQSRALAKALYILMKNNVDLRHDDDLLLMKKASCLDDDEKVAGNEEQKKNNKPSFMQAGDLPEAIKRLSWFGLVNQENYDKLTSDPIFAKRIAEMPEKLFKAIFLYFHQNSADLIHIDPIDVFLLQKNDEWLLPRLKFEAYIGNCRRLPTSFLARYSSSEKIAVATQLIGRYLYRDPSVVFTERDIKILQTSDLFKLVTELKLPIPKVNAEQHHAPNVMP